MNGPMGSLRLDIHNALRLIRKVPGFIPIVAPTLALGIGGLAPPRSQDVCDDRDQHGNGAHGWHEADGAQPPHAVEGGSGLRSWSGRHFASLDSSHAGNYLYRIAERFISGVDVAAQRLRAALQPCAAAPTATGTGPGAHRALTRRKRAEAT